MAATETRQPRPGNRGPATEDSRAGFGGGGHHGGQAPAWPYRLNQGGGGSRVKGDGPQAVIGEADAEGALDA